MFRTPIIAALTVALLGGTAMAQPANAPPNNLSNSARSAPDYDDDEAPPSDRPSDRGIANGPPDARPDASYGNSQRDPARKREPTVTCSAAATLRRAPAI